MRSVSAAVWLRVDSAATRGDDSVGTRPMHTLVIGDASVEWFARICDSDGEAGGDLVRGGRVAYSSREAALFCGLMTGQRSRAVLGMMRREPLAATEMVYNEVEKLQAEDEDEDDEDDVEEEEED